MPTETKNRTKDKAETTTAKIKALRQAPRHRKITIQANKCFESEVSVCEQILYVIKGDGVISCISKNMNLKAEDMKFIPPRTRFKIENTGTNVLKIRLTEIRKS